MEVKQVHKVDQNLLPHFISALSSPAFCLLADDFSAIMQELDFVTDGTIFLWCVTWVMLGTYQHHSISE